MDNSPTCIDIKKIYMKKYYFNIFLIKNNLKRNIYHTIIILNLIKKYNRNNFLKYFSLENI